MNEGLEDLQSEWLQRGWPQDLLERAFKAGMSARIVAWWLNDRVDYSLDLVQRWISDRERLRFGTIRGREATWADNDAFADLWANAPEQIGEWELTVERSPNAFAQYQLQENVSIPVLEQDGRLLACVVWAQRNVLVAGRPFSVHCGEGLRVRKECRGEGYGNLVRAVRRPVWLPPTMGQYHYIRSQNYAAVDFFRHTSPRVVESSPEREGDVPGLPVSVWQFPRRAFDAEGSGIRSATRADVRRCVALINNTHLGMDLFRRHTEDSFALRLDEGFWGQRPVLWWHVYGWEDFYIVEENSRVVACGGLWDRGRDMRERWRHIPTGEERVVSNTALMDLGFEPGHEAAMARLIGYLVAKTDRLGRDYLVASIDDQPELRARVEHLEGVRETRALGWLLWDEFDRPVDVAQEAPITRPYTDLAYW